MKKIIFSLVFVIIVSCLFIYFYNRRNITEFDFNKVTEVDIGIPIITEGYPIHDTEYLKVTYKDAAELLNYLDDLRFYEVKECKTTIIEVEEDYRVFASFDNNSEISFDEGCAVFYDYDSGSKTQYKTDYKIDEIKDIILTINNEYQEVVVSKEETDLYDLSDKLLATDLKLKSEADFNNATLVIVSDPLIELDDYEGAYRSNNGKIFSAITGTYGTFIVNEETELLVEITKDNTENNGYYVYSTSKKNSATTDIYYYKDIFIIFDTILAEDASNDKLDNLKAANEVKKIVFAEILDFYKE